ncbi:phenylalanyl-tRNA synthetase subunit beta [Spiroplasma syrphidicola EA-1]|uniref:Phenylalanine--tRNA ligase beta subunit n=1 Tax=Spiroplasma syrphidicola EA-1 TaxID=1276229 RepID=R4UM13_9MOLU|nr:phenylalanine--tRNA ligase subunit beta [Spiroplasma syrphidicola]AGM26271.1 phenylalanyl-tRNA synthetase subunit beta [Spiroplasma syrphidicola EA-1]
MIITRNWLEKYLDLNNISNDHIVEALNKLGFEVDSVVDYNKNSNVVGGRIQVVNKIPNTHLNFCLVDTKQDLVDPIVCGAANPVEEGYVAVARPGAKLANGMEIQIREVQGHSSEGMMCSFSELGISEKYLTELEQDEIVMLKLPSEEGYNLIGKEDILTDWGFTDVAFEVDLTLNRSDCLSAYELARELAAFFDRPLLPLLIETTEQLPKYDQDLKIIIDSPEIIKSSAVNVKLQNLDQSLALAKRVWLKINQYCSDIAKPLDDLQIQTTIETGQPIIVYDYHKIKTGLRITTDYENAEFKIAKGDLVILDGDDFVELVGVRVNPNYLVSSTTTEITILALKVNHLLMRRQQRKVGISNINLQRYLKPLSSSTVNFGLSRFLMLLEEHRFLAELSTVNYVREYSEKPVSLAITLTEINALIGHQFNSEQIKNLLTPLGFSVADSGENKFEIISPATRTDIQQKADLIEEIARLYGYDEIIAKPPVVPNLAKKRLASEKTIQNFENFLLNQGFYQAKTYSLVPQTEIEQFNFFNYKKPYQLLSPLSQEHEMMRVSLLNSLLEAGIYNNTRNNNNIKLFTVEKVYVNQGDSYYHGAFIAQNEIINNLVTKEKIDNSFYYMKGLFEGFCAKEGLDLAALDYRLAPASTVYHPYRTSLIYYHNQLLGIIGVIHPQYQKEHDLNPTYFCEFQFDIIFKANHQVVKFQEVSKFTPSSRDISILLKGDQQYGLIKNQIITGVNYLTDVRVIDKYRDPKTMSDEVALTISFTFNNLTHQLTEQEINLEFDKIKEHLTKLKIVIR